jgi:hypothetical protein
MIQAVERWWLPVAVVWLPFLALIFLSTRTSGFLASRAWGTVMVAVGWLLMLCGGAGLAGGLYFLRLALGPENSGNEWRELGIGMGVAAAVLGAAVGIAGLFMVHGGSRRRRQVGNASRQP